MTPTSDLRFEFAGDAGPFREAADYAAGAFTRLIQAMVFPHDTAGLKARAKRGSKAARVELGLRGIYPSRLWRG
jgi:hypothetical protein